MTQVLEDIGDDIAYRIQASTSWPVPMDFPGGSAWPANPRLILPPSTPICWSPNGVTWTKPGPGGPILRGPNGSYITPTPQLPTGDRGPVTGGHGTVVPPGGSAGPTPVNGAPELTSADGEERQAGMAVNGAGSRLPWGLLLAGGVAYMIWRARRRGGRR